MFTGIINHMGKFIGYRAGKAEMSLDASSLADRLELGESLAVNGICLSLIKKAKNSLTFNLSEETLKTTTLGRLKPGEMLNLELPLTLSDPLSGHLVTGHADGTGSVSKIVNKGKGKRFTISVPSNLMDLMVMKGSVAVNGVSLTVMGIGPSQFEIELIPITLESSNLGNLRRGDIVNIECDMIGKYVYNWVLKHK
jgi:riboflavin synthase